MYFELFFTLLTFLEGTGRVTGHTLYKQTQIDYG